MNEGKMLSKYDDDGGRVDFPYTATELATSEDELMNVIVPQSVTRSSLSEKVVTEESPFKEEKYKRTCFTTGSCVSWTKAIVAMALLLLASMVFQRAHAEPTGTSLLDTSLTLPAPTPRVTRFDAVTAFSNATKGIHVQEKDRPQTWFWHPNSSRRSSTNWFMMLCPLLLIGYFALSSIASETLTKRMETADSTNLAARSAAPEASAIEITYYSTTTVYPPAFGAPTPNSATSGSATHATDAVSGSRQSSSVVTGSTCKGSDPVACSIELGQNPRSSASFVASRSTMLVALLAVVAGFGLTMAFVV